MVEHSSASNFEEWLETKDVVNWDVFAKHKAKNGGNLWVGTRASE